MKKSSKSLSFIVDDNIIYINTLKSVNTEDGSTLQANEIYSYLTNLFVKDKAKKFNIVFTMTSHHHSNIMSDKAISIYKEIAKNSQLEKIAIIGDNIIFKSFARFIMTATRNNNKINFYSDKSKAVKWIREGIVDN